MELHTRYHTLKARLNELRKQGKSIGFVPTMGALHQGHLSLMRQAQKQNDVVVVSIFVNPTQFNNAHDLEKYPRNLQKDCDLIQTLEGDFLLYAPSVDDVYQGNTTAEKFDFGLLDKVMEGAYRPGHFDGVATVVRKLFERVNPSRAYFGEKDFQQLLIVKEMVKQLSLPVEIIPSPIVREASGLAMSSRNERLSNEMRKDAAFIYQTLLIVKENKKKWSLQELNQFVEGAFSSDNRFDLEYFVIANSETLQPTFQIIEGESYRAFIAVNVEGVRLIDNLSLD